MVDDEGERMTVARSRGTLWSVIRSVDFNLSVVKKHWTVLSREEWHDLNYVCLTLIYK